MNPQAIVRLLDHHPVGYACGKCGLFHSTDIYACPAQRALEAALDAATRCCDPRCMDCGGSCELGWTVCTTCRTTMEREKEAAAFAKAKKVPLSEYDGHFIFIDGAGVEGYVLPEDIEDALEELLSDGCEVPEYAWACEPEGASLDLERALEAALEKHHEDASDDVDWKKIAEAQAIVTEALKGVVSYHEAHKVAVLLPRPVLDAEGFIVRLDPPEMPAETSTP